MPALVCALMVLVALGASVAPAQATFPGRNGGIAFSQHSGTGDLEPRFVEHARLVVALPPPGSRRERVLLDCELTDGTPTAGDCTGTSYRTPSYSRDGRTIVFDAGERLALIAADGGRPVLLPAASADDGDPCFSPDGERIVFTGANDRGGTDLYTRRLDGGAARLIVHDAGQPAWSSRNRLAYVRSGNIYSARPSGGDCRWVTSGVSPDWSPSGRRLVLIRPLPRLVFDGPTGRMYVVLPTGRGLRQVGRSTNVSHPVWSPDGRWIAYDGFDLGVHAKHLGSREGPREVAPTQVSGESGTVASFSPAWRPRPRS
jgi:Tol biopolymer transport system component